MERQFAPPVAYDPDRQPDWQYHELLDDIMSRGEYIGKTQMEESVRRIIAPNALRFDFAKGGFPIITERDLSLAATDQNIANHQTDPGLKPISGPLRQGLGEIIAFINGARTNDQLSEMGCKWWVHWTSEEKCAKRGLETGDLGPGSYGAAFADFPTSEGTGFNQIKHVIEQMRELPHLRTHIVTPFIPQYIGRGEGKQQKVVVVPCHGLMHFYVTPLDNGERVLDLVHWQRSADAPVGLPYNMVHYAAMAMMVAQVIGATPRSLVHQISDAHIYQRQQEDVEQILSRDPRKFPILKINPAVTELEQFRVDDFAIEEYEPHPPMKLPTPV